MLHREFKIRRKIPLCSLCTPRLTARVVRLPAIPTESFRSFSRMLGGQFGLGGHRPEFFEMLPKPYRKAIERLEVASSNGWIGEAIEFNGSIQRMHVVDWTEVKGGRPSQHKYIIAKLESWMVFIGISKVGDPSCSRNRVGKLVFVVCVCEPMQIRFRN